MLLRHEDAGKGGRTGFGDMRIVGDTHKSMLCRLLRKRNILECTGGYVSTLCPLPHLPHLFPTLGSLLHLDYLSETALAKNTNSFLVIKSNGYFLLLLLTLISQQQSRPTLSP